MLITDQDDLDNDPLMDEIADTDYIFVVDAQGMMKSVILPDNYETAETPESVTKILELFDFNYFYSDTIH